MTSTGKKNPSIFRSYMQSHHVNSKSIINIVRAWNAQGIVVAEHNAFWQNLKNPGPWFRIAALEKCEQNLIGQTKPRHFLL